MAAACFGHRGDPAPPASAGTSPTSASGDFAKFGLLLFTVRNGVPGVDGHTKPYAEKMMVVQPGQVTPLHFHWAKMEDIINPRRRHAGDATLPQHGQRRVGSALRRSAIDRRHPARKCRPARSCAFRPRARAFACRSGCTTPSGPRCACVVGEVSMVNDDHCDNRFYQRVGRFPEIVEDESPLHLLSSDLQTSACPENAANAARN